MKPSRLILLSFLALILPLHAQQETPEKRDARLKWWREARFGLFIHWGVYSALGGTHAGKTLPAGGESIMRTSRISVADYAKAAAGFNPTKFDAESWAQTIQDTGAKYVVVTAKYQDGFAMFPTATSPFSLNATPFKRDPLKELAAACKKRDIKFCLYYSHAQDWLNPGGSAYANDNLWMGTGKKWDKAQEGDFDRYLARVAVPQMKELLENYDPALFWFDTPMGMTRARGLNFAPFLRPTQGMISNDRLGGPTAGLPGDFVSVENFVPAGGIANRDWETCMSLNDSWGHTAKDTKYKTTAELLRRMVESVAKGGNFLLNAAPNGEGVFIKTELDRLKEIGAWMKVNGESIHGATASPFRRKLRWGYCTQRPGKLYAHVFKWPANGTLVVPIGSPATKVSLLSKPGEELKFTSDPDGVRITVPAQAPDANVTVVALDVPGPVDALGLTQNKDGTIDVLAEEAFVMGTEARLEHEPLNIGYWYNDDYITYPVKIHTPGKFRVEFDFAIDPGSNGNQFTVEAGAAPMRGVLTNSGSWGDYSVANFGELEIRKTGVVQIIIRPVNPKPRVGLINLRSMLLTPARPVVGAIRWDAFHTQTPPKDPAKPKPKVIEEVPDLDADGNPIGKPKVEPAQDPNDPANAPPRVVERNLSPAKYQGRAPFFAKVAGPEKLKIDGYTTAVINEELRLARAGGIDYWAFLLYEEDNPMSQALNLYLASLRRREVNFCAIAPAYIFGLEAEFPTKMQRIVKMMGGHSHQTVLGNRPLFYLMDVTDEALEAWGGAAKAKALFDGLRDAAKEAKLGNPYIVVLDYDPAHGKSVMETIGADAISAYATHGTGKNAPFADLTKGTRGFWETCAATGAATVPIAMSGWDRRPRVENPVPWEPWQKRGEGLDEFYQTPTPAELAAHLKEALDWTTEKKSPARTVLTYAWNEHDEGGYLCPTIGPDGKPVTTKLDAISAMLKAYRVGRKP